MIPYVLFNSFDVFTIISTVWEYFSKLKIAGVFTVFYVQSLKKMRNLAIEHDLGEILFLLNCACHFFKCSLLLFLKCGWQTLWDRGREKADSKGLTERGVSRVRQHAE
jgi:hypothetical protein